MSGFSRDSVPSWQETVARTSPAEWQRMEDRRQWAWIAVAGVVAFVVIVGFLWVWTGGDLP